MTITSDQKSVIERNVRDNRQSLPPQKRQQGNNKSNLPVNPNLSNYGLLASALATMILVPTIIEASAKV